MEVSLHAGVRRETAGNRRRLAPAFLSWFSSIFSNGKPEEIVPAIDGTPRLIECDLLLQLCCV
ncbi:MAG TPA: hypothetical protein VGZ00_00185 [Candidatus Baltobacteraceae bacterium]|nr:hypothetical protein [Candidatus Baltobacteraceae bacterium]